MQEGQRDASQFRIQGFHEFDREVIQGVLSPRVGLPQVEIQPAVPFFIIYMHIFTQECLQFIIEVGDAFPDTFTPVMRCIDIQQFGIAEIRITQEFVILPRDQIMRYPVMAFPCDRLRGYRGE